jgi:hypothetical protein
MIFNVSENFESIESYKERNLYYKIFAGYFFNELIDGIEDRKHKFFDLLSDVLKQPERFLGGEERTMKILEAVRNGEMHVTFDYHSIQPLKSGEEVDHGEMSDVLLWSKSAFISIECKFLENMDINNDVLKVQKRIDLMKQNMKMDDALQVLLMKEFKWKNSIKRSQNNPSFFTDVHAARLSFPVIVICWDELVSLITDGKVKNYLKRQIERKKIKD